MENHSDMIGIDEEDLFSAEIEGKSFHFAFLGSISDRLFLYAGNYRIASYDRIIVMNTLFGMGIFEYVCVTQIIRKKRVPPKILVLSNRFENFWSPVQEKDGVCFD